jgi:transcriptional regulator with XRE-family HTH domain
MTPPANFSARISDLRARHDLSIEELAAQLRISASHVYQLERGTRTPSDGRKKTHE